MYRNMDHETFNYIFTMKATERDAIRLNHRYILDSIYLGRTRLGALYNYLWLNTVNYAIRILAHALHM